VTLTDKLVPLIIFEPTGNSTVFSLTLSDFDGRYVLLSNQARMQPLKLGAASGSEVQMSHTFTYTVTTTKTAIDNFYSLDVRVKRDAVMLLAALSPMFFVLINKLC